MLPTMDGKIENSQNLIKIYVCTSFQGVGFENAITFSIFAQRTINERPESMKKMIKRITFSGPIKIV